MCTFHYVGSKHQVASDTELETVILRCRVLDRRCSTVPGAVVDIWYSGQALTNKVRSYYDLCYYT